MSKGRAERRWKTFAKYVSRIRKRLSWMRVQYGETTYVGYDGKERVKTLWRSPKDWKEADANDTTAAKSLKDTPTPYKEPWKDAYDHQRIKNMRDESRRIIEDELNNKI